MTEPLPKRVIAYMESGGRLFRLKRIRCYNGNIRPILAAIVDGSEFTSRSKYAFGSAVFLSLDVDLTGLAVEKILDVATPACSDCWALRDEAVHASTIDKQKDLQQVAADNDIPAEAVPWCG